MWLWYHLSIKDAYLSFVTLSISFSYWPQMPRCAVSSQRLIRRSERHRMIRHGAHPLFLTRSNRLATMENRRYGVYGWFGVTRPVFDPENRFVASPYLPPLVLSLLRLTIAVYMTACIIANPILLKKNRRTRRESFKFPAYFTNITFMSLCA
jgi:hypothetical protein